MKKQPGEIEQLTRRIEELERRLNALEASRSIPGSGARIIQPGIGRSSLARAEESSAGQQVSFESRIGEYGMAWLGNIVLLFGIIFLTNFLSRNDQGALSLLVGLISVAGIYGLGYFTKRSFPYMSRLFSYNGHILLFFLSLLLFMFPGTRIVTTNLAGYGIVLLVIVTFLYLAFRNRSQLMTVIVWIMAVVAGVASNSSYFMLALLVGITGTSLFAAQREGWWTGLLIAVVLVYSTFLIWITGNPFQTGSMKIISLHQNGHLFLFICALGYSLLGLFPKSERIPEPYLTGAIVLNGLGFSMLLTFATLAFFTENFYVYFGLIAAFCMGYSILVLIRGDWKPVAAMYALYGFVALSITIGGIYRFPLAFFLLAIQSLLVVSMALWFRSRFIVIMNTLLFVSLLITYLATADPLSSINFSFAIVALVTARILNWKKQRLEIRTEMIRNIYLFTGVVMVLFSLYQAVPPNFVTLSWALSALLFFVLSVLIRNMKYRWLAILTMVAAVFYLFIVDLKNISLGYRVVALLFISLVSLGISIFYARWQKQHREEEKPDEPQSA